MDSPRRTHDATSSQTVEKERSCDGRRTNDPKRARELGSSPEETGLAVEENCLSGRGWGDARGARTTHLKFSHSMREIMPLFVVKEPAASAVG